MGPPYPETPPWPWHDLITWWVVCCHVTVSCDWGRTRPSRWQSVLVCGGGLLGNPRPLVKSYSCTPMGQWSSLVPALTYMNENKQSLGQENNVKGERKRQMWKPGKIMKFYCQSKISFWQEQGNAQHALVMEGISKSDLWPSFGLLVPKEFFFASHLRKKFNMKDKSEGTEVLDSQPKSLTNIAFLLCKPEKLPMLGKLPVSNCFMLLSCSHHLGLEISVGPHSALISSPGCRWQFARRQICVLEICKWLSWGAVPHFTTAGLPWWADMQLSLLGCSFICLALCLPLEQ